MQSFNRNLLTAKEVENFVYNVLGITDDEEYVDAIKKIISVENQLIEFNKHQTLFDETYWIYPYNDNKQRRSLDSYSNEPILNYYKITKHYKDSFDGYAHIDTDVEFGEPALIVEDNNVGLNKLLIDNEGRYNFEQNSFK